MDLLARIFISEDNGQYMYATRYIRSLLIILEFPLAINLNFKKCKSRWNLLLEVTLSPMLSMLVKTIAEPSKVAF